MTAMKDLVDYLRKSPSVVYPAEVLEYAMPAEAECAWLRELASDYMHANERLLTELKRYKGIVRARYQDPVPHLVNENAKLREQIHWLKQGDILHVLTDQEYIDQCERERLMQVSIDALETENEKLRELVRDMWHEGAFEPGACYVYEAERLEERTRELGIEVGHDA